MKHETFKYNNMSFKHNNIPRVIILCQPEFPYKIQILNYINEYFKIYCCLLAIVLNCV